MVMAEVQAGERKPLPELVEVIRRRWAAPWVAMDEGVQYVFAKGDIANLLEAYDDLAWRLVEATGIYPVSDWEFAHAPEPEEPPPDPPDDWDEDSDDDKPHYDTPGGY
jgi:hypothetical protein